MWGAFLFGAPAIPDGSLLFLENSNLFVELYTGSGMTHVAVVVHEEGAPYVYEATPREVRRVTLDDYFAELGELNVRRREGKKIRMWLAAPREPYTQKQLAAMRKLLASQVGRRYSIKGYVRGDSDGIHCAELASRALCAANVLDIERCQDQSPADVLKQVESHSRPLSLLTIDPPAERKPWLERRWIQGWAFCDWCQWSCWEAWTFCW